MWIGSDEHLTPFELRVTTGGLGVHVFAFLPQGFI